VLVDLRIIGEIFSQLQSIKVSLSNDYNESKPNIFFNLFLKEKLCVIQRELLGIV